MCLDDTDYRIPDRKQWPRSTKHVVVAGSGYSAATSVCELSDIVPHITWITRDNRACPVAPIPDDSLPERAALTKRANRLALDRSSAITWRPGLLVHSIDRTTTGFRLMLTDRQGVREELDCDRLVANPGFRPDVRPFEELQVHRCYATEGPIKMAAHLLGESGSDCLRQSVPGPDLLRNPEPDFFILGAAGYGRDSHFLLKSGFEQLEQLFESLGLKKEVAS